MASFGDRRVALISADLMNIFGLTTTMSNMNLSNTTVKWGAVFQATEAATLTQIGVRYGTRTGTPPTYKISLQGVDASGVPDGTIKGAGNACYATFTPPADATWNGLFKWFTMGLSYNCAQGELLAIVVEYSSGTCDSSNYGSFSYTPATTYGWPYRCTNTGSWTKYTYVPIYGYASASKSYGFPLQGVEATAFSSNSTPDERALRFLLNSGCGDTYQVVGAELDITNPAATKDYVMSLYAGTSSSQAITWDGDHNPSAATHANTTHLFDEATLSDLDFGTGYRLALAPSATSANLGLYVMVFASAQDAAAVGNGEWYLSTRTDAGAWSDDTTRIPVVALIVRDITAPAASSGGAYTFGG